MATPSPMPLKPFPLQFPETAAHHPASLASRYEALFRAADFLRSYRDLPGLFRALPYRLRPVLDFDYMSIFLDAEGENDACWYVLNDQGELVRAASKDVPAEQPYVSWVSEHLKPTFIPRLDQDIRFFGAGRLLSHRGLQSASALPLHIPERRRGVMFLASEFAQTFTENEVRFLSFVANRINVAIAGLSSSNNLYNENIELREDVASAAMFEEIIGSSEALNRVLSQVVKVAPTQATVLITGESGTGKELIARAIHQHSPRAGGPFLRVNCAAIPHSLIASELFGYEKGAFTGAAQRRLGRFEMANGGTLFLDEIGEIPPETQLALLRVLQEREFERVGGGQPIPTDVRVIAATNSNLPAAVTAGTFRLDLFYRLNVFPIVMPPLRERREDIVLLAKYFIDCFAAKSSKKIRNIDRKTLDRLTSYDWPGNIRELQNVMERAVILCDDDTLSIDESWLQSETRRPAAVPVALSEAIESREKEMIEAVLEETRGRISGPSGAAGKLGIPRTTLESKIKSLRINKHQFKCV
jgi:transcriptional regulator with GAF, ATPase, and Fis domain